MIKSRRKSIIALLVIVLAITAITTASFAVWYDLKGSMDVVANSGDWDNSAAHLSFSPVTENEEIVGYMLTGFDYAVAEITVPSVFQDKPVVGVAGSFRRIPNIIRITLPSTIKIIEPLALSNMDNLISITIEEGLTSIGASALSYNNKLTKITLPSTLTSIGDVAVSYCDSMVEVNILAQKSNVVLSPLALAYNTNQSVKVSWGGNA